VALRTRTRTAKAKLFAKGGTELVSLILRDYLSVRRREIVEDLGPASVSGKVRHPRYHVDVQMVV
jgi:hypothetical protein